MSPTAQVSSALFSSLSLVYVASFPNIKSPCPHASNPVGPALTSGCFPEIGRNYWVCFLLNVRSPCPESWACFMGQSHGGGRGVNVNVLSMAPSPEPQRLHDFVWKPGGCWMSLASVFPSAFHMLTAPEPATPAGNCASLGTCIIVTRLGMMCR